jgi:multiple sugar transport system substrate-binding protein
LTEAEKKVSRRGFVKYVGGAVVVAAVAGAGYYVYQGSQVPPPPVPTLTPTLTQTATTASPPPTTALPVAASLRGETTSDPNFYLWDKDTPVTHGGLLVEYKNKVGTEITLERLDWSTHYEKSRLELQSKSPTYDFFCYDSYVRGSYLPNDWFYDYKELESKTGLDMGLDDIIPKIVQDEGTFDGKIEAIPSGAFMAPFFCYRKSLFEDAKLKDEFEKKYGHPLALPNSWEEVNELSEFFTRTINGTKWYGTSILMAPDAASDEFYFRWLTTGGGKGGRKASMLIVDDKFQPLINNDTGVKALELQLEIFKNKWCAPGGTEVSWVDVTSNYFAGDVALGYMWSCAWNGVNDPSVSKAAGDTGWHVMPVSGDGVNGHASLMMAINKFGKQPEDTYRFLNWMFAPEQDKRMALIGNNPIRLSTYKDPDVIADPMNKAILGMIASPSVPQCDLPEFGDMNHEFTLEIQNAALGKKSAKQALDDTVATWRDMLKKAGYYS